MSAVWQAARAAVRRRRLQTGVVGLVVLVSTMTIVVALGLLDAASAPFERAFEQQQGAQVMATFDSAVPLPDEAGFDIGASLGVPALTAHRALTVAEDGPSRLRPGALDGKVVLAAGGAGAVGHAVIQLARWAGATVISTISTPEKARLATAAGAHHVINYREGDPAARIREIAPDGIDIVAEVALGANLALDLAVLRTRGTISTYANDGGKPVELDVPQNMVLNTRLQFLVLYTAGPQARAAAAQDVAAAVRDGALPVGDEHGLPLIRFPLDRTADAHRAVESRAIGKVLVDIAS
ncbi:zinc-binding dehydrogenase [Streptomyces tateyamensis]|uniref:zinc-binding dehydrogenase n=1 Tax=Streptomyces tateyamensis TaxID=565073 RepID=UPI001FE6414C|nr:zinc-binding dehydrogenase [Streptomyces tateyamensis]